MDRLATLRAFHEEDPEDPFVRFALASEYRKLGDLDRACELFEALVAHAPDYVGTYYHLGKAYEETERPEEAASTYRAGISEATRIGDSHARSELQAALLELEDAYET